MDHKYPKSYLKNCDEDYEKAKASFEQVKTVLRQKVAEIKGNPNRVVDTLIMEIWSNTGLRDDDEMNKA
jgi:hypothetical protein